MQVVAIGGELTSLLAFTRRLEGRNEITTGGILSNASVALFEAKRMDTNHKEFYDGVQGIGYNQVSFVDKRRLTEKKAVFKKDAKDGFLNHALMSGISAEDAFYAFQQSGTKWS